MELEQVQLNWRLDTSQKWRIDRITGTVSGLSVGQPVEFDSGVVIINSKPWGVGTHKANTDIISGFRLDNTTSRPTVRIAIERATCLICDVATATPEFWIATMKGGLDYYDRDWKLGKAWIVRATNATTGVAQGNEVQITPSDDVLVNSISWGKITNYDKNLDKATGTRGPDPGVPITIRRRAAVICTFPASGGNSWVAVEGGIP